ncbi:DnaB-like helicase N-terminal domain-containing protein [Actinacidiphila glaucinigra]|uniref:DnaB-like helicase N-terminal domain-containing protein n=1 Tax=Actinacidiphila glaucinigra TaxID=235986 RepID=UPI003717B97C
MPTPSHSTGTGNFGTCPPGHLGGPHVQDLDWHSDPDQPPSGPALYDEHAEHTVLAASVRHPQLTPYFMAVLRPAHFSSLTCREVFLAAAAVYRNKETCTPAAVAAELERQQQAGADGSAHEAR